MVYVDNMNASYGRMIMNHLFADTIKELHVMVDLIGVSTRWFQDKNKKFPHYDICLSKKKLALQNGANEIEYRNLPKFIKNIERLK